MALEAGTYVNDLVTTNPVGAADFVSAGDDHLRLVKSVLKATFPNASRAFYLPTSIALQTATVTLVAADQNKIIPVSCEDAARTVNLPANATLPDGWQVTIVKADHSPNTLTIDGSGSDTINGNLTTILYQRYQTARLTWCATISAWIADIPQQTPIGFISPNFSSVLPPGWLWANGTTIGNASSAGTGRANVDCLGLFTILWNALSDTNAAVSGGRGASAAIDFAANKRITIPNMAGYVPAGRDGMNSVAVVNLLTATYFGITSATLGNKGGSEKHILTEAQMPSHLHGAGTYAAATNGDHFHDYIAPTGTTGSHETGSGRTGDPTSVTAGTNTSTDGDHTHDITGNSSSAGSDAAHNNTQPTIITNYMIKL